MTTDAARSGAHPEGPRAREPADVERSHRPRPSPTAGRASSSAARSACSRRARRSGATAGTRARPRADRAPDADHRRRRARLRRQRHRARHHRAVGQPGALRADGAHGRRRRAPAADAAEPARAREPPHGRLHGDGRRLTARRVGHVRRIHHRRHRRRRRQHRPLRQPRWRRSATASPATSPTPTCSAGGARSTWTLDQRRRLRLELHRTAHRGRIGLVARHARARRHGAARALHGVCRDVRTGRRHGPHREPDADGVVPRHGRRVRRGTPDRARAIWPASSPAWWTCRARSTGLGEPFDLGRVCGPRQRHARPVHDRTARPRHGHASRAACATGRPTSPCSRPWVRR